VSQWPKKDGFYDTCRIVDIVDGDTITVEGPWTGSLRWRLRIKDCYAPEKNTEAGKRAHEYAKQLLCGETHVRVFVAAIKKIGPKNILDFVTFNRVPAEVQLRDGRDYATEMIRAGHATKRKLKALTVKPRRTP
jgi:endonuclease YncB( thermonuclease family)